MWVAETYKFGKTISMDAENKPLFPMQEPPKQPNEQQTPQLSYRQQRMPKYRKIVRWLWISYIGGISLVTLLFVWLSYQLPSFEQLENPRSRIASVVYSADGEVLGKYYVENRTPVDYDSISPHVIKALISTEDARFYDHAGIDPQALGRVAFKTLFLQNESSGGGSTISQQLAKLLVGRPDTKSGGIIRMWRMLTTKLKEWLTAVKLERSYTKEEILTLYLNEFDFLYGAYGIRSAAETYFGKHPKDLSITESAMLVRMLKNPSLYNPRRDMAKAVKGREQVLRNMYDSGIITREQYDQYRQETIDISHFKQRDHNEGVATYFREYLREYLKKLFNDPTVQLLKTKPDGKPWDIYRDGLKIYTTLDSRMQMHAEKAVWDHLSEHQKKMFEHWGNWNGKNTKGEKLDPWTYKAHGTTDEEISLRQLAFEKLLWQSERYKSIREEYLPTAVANKVRDSDIFRIKEVEKADQRAAANTNKKRDKVKSGQDLLNDWINQKFITHADAKKYREVMGSPDWAKIKQEYAKIIEMMGKPVQMSVFCYNKRAEKDTLMSPIDSIKYHRMHLQTGMMAMDPFTGAIKAWVGGINHKYFKYDHVNKSTARQVGSTIKPFVYSLVIDRRGYSPCQRVCDVETTIEKGYGSFGLYRDWTPRNAGGGYSGACMTMVEALRKSLNSVSAQFMKDLGSVAPLRDYLNEVGMDTSKAPNNPTLCLGTAEMSVFEMTGGYAAFANGGFYNEPIFIERIEDRNGNPIYEPDPMFHRVLPKTVAYAMSELLRGTQSGAGGFNGIKSLYGGKTGTTNYQADGWFMGITPHTVIGTWVGNDDRFIRFRSLGYGQGARMARPIFQNFMRNIEADTALEINVTQQFPQLALEEVGRYEMNCLKHTQFNDAGDEFMDYTKDYEWDFGDGPPKPNPINTNPNTNTNGLPPDTE